MNVWRSYWCLPFIVAHSLVVGPQTGLTALSSSNIRINSTAGSQLITVTINTQQPHYPGVVSVVLGPSTDPAAYTCKHMVIANNASLTTSLHCVLPPVVGGNMTLALQSCPSLVSGCFLNSGLQQLFTTPPPSLTDNSLRLFQAGPGAGAATLRLANTFSALIAFDGTNLGADMVVTYGPPAKTALFECVVDVLLTTSTTIACTTEQNAFGDALVFQVSVPSAGYSLRSSFSLDYPVDLPTITQVSGCQPNGLSTQQCATAGGTHVTVAGKNFTAPVVVLGAV